MEYRITKLIEQIINNENPLVSFTDTYKIHEILENKGYWKREFVTVKNYGLFSGRKNKTVESKIVAKPFKFRVNHCHGNLTQNTYNVGQKTAEITDLNKEEVIGY